MTARVLMVDNYDSFTYNLVQALRMLGADVQVHRNDSLSVEAALALEPTHVVVSPGPGRPVDAGISEALITAALGRIPLLGVCLGHQALCEVLGGKVVAARRLMHGKPSDVLHDGRGVFAGLPQPMVCGRYHSLAVAEPPPQLEVSAKTADGEVMAVRHRKLAAVGVQFHPESILTPDGPALLANFLKLVPPPGSPRPLQCRTPLCFDGPPVDGTSPLLEGGCRPPCAFGAPHWRSLRARSARATTPSWMVQNLWARALGGTAPGRRS